MTTTPLTDQQLADIEATIPHHYEGPWTFQLDDDGRDWLVSYPSGSSLAGHVATVPDYGYDLAEFIAAARTNVPALLAELARLRAELATARAAAFREAARVLEDTGHDDDAVNVLDNIADGIAPAGVVHACPPGNSSLTPCCGKTPFELSRTDRLTYDQAEITCPAVPSA